MTRHTLPQLPFAYDALEPYFDAQTMEIHHQKHHAAYVNNLNKALERFPELKDVPVEDLLRSVGSVPAEIHEAVHNHGGGHANHSFFWQLLNKKGGGEAVGMLKKAIEGQFSSFDVFKSRFNEAAASRFGSGWAWLSVGRFENLLIHSTPNQHSPLINGLEPIIGLDVWEHAYYLKYQNRRPEYIEAFWKLVDWEKAEENFRKAIGK